MRLSGQAEPDSRELAIAAIVAFVALVHAREHRRRAEAERATDDLARLGITIQFSLPPFLLGEEVRDGTR